ncbi:hypothetical protein JXI42_03510 [bacterium]|nr:hypothetical protein [bacterium]
MKIRSLILLITILILTLAIACSLPQKIENEAEKVATAKIDLENPATKFLVELGFRIMEFDPNVDARHEPQLRYDLDDLRAEDAKITHYFKTKEGDKLWAVEVGFTATDRRTNNEVHGVSIMHYGTIDIGLAELAASMPTGMPGDMPYPGGTPYPSTTPPPGYEEEMGEEPESEGIQTEGNLLYIYTGFNDKEVLNIQTAVEKNFKAMKRMKSISKAMKLFK